MSKPVAIQKILKPGPLDALVHWLHCFTQRSHDEPEKLEGPAAGRPRSASCRGERQRFGGFTAVHRSLPGHTTHHVFDGTAFSIRAKPTVSTDPFCVFFEEDGEDGEDGGVFFQCLVEDHSSHQEGGNIQLYIIPDTCFKTFGFLLNHLQPEWAESVCFALVSRPRKWPAFLFRDEFRFNSPLPSLPSPRGFSPASSGGGAHDRPVGLGYLHRRALRAHVPALRAHPEGPLHRREGRGVSVSGLVSVSGELVFAVTCEWLAFSFICFLDGGSWCSDGWEKTVFVLFFFGWKKAARGWRMFLFVIFSTDR